MLAGMETDISIWAYGLLAGLAAGGIGGVLAGLAGVGGGLIYVPLLYAMLPGTHDGAAIPVFGSMVAVVITGFFSARTHWRLGHTDMPSLKLLLPGLAVGASIGLWSTLHLPEAWVLAGLGLLDAWIARDYGRELNPAQGRKLHLRLVSLPIGYLSGSLGIGGGTMLTPALRRTLPLRHAVGTSAACGLLMAAMAVGINVAAEENWRAMLGEHLPFLASFWIGILIILPHSTGWAARLHGEIGEELLRAVLKGLFMLLSLCLIIAAGLKM